LSRSGTALQVKDDGNVRRYCYRYQRTLARSAEVRGIGLLTGADVCLRFQPAAPSQGIVFVRTDLRRPVLIPAHIHQVSGTHRRTTLGTPPAQVGLVEHVLAALAGLRIDNCFVELDAPEPPGLDGSALQFVEALRAAGVVLQPARRPVWGAETPLTVAQDGATLSLHPAEANELKVSYLLDYGPGSPIGWQMHTVVINPENFASNLAGSRTFILESEVAGLRRQGLGARTSTADLLVFGKRGPVGNCLRHADEPARHKILDLIGDLSLFGQDLRGHLVAYRSGHPLNIELVRALCRRQAGGCPAPRLAA
jgi:UDP-3-O-acyl N-acetylglucosamine deacetylase